MTATKYTNEQLFDMIRRRECLAIFVWDEAAREIRYRLHPDTGVLRSGHVTPTLIREYVPAFRAWMLDHDHALLCREVGCCVEIVERDGPWPRLVGGKWIDRP